MITYRLNIAIFCTFIMRHCCVANTHALDHKTLNAHEQIRKTDLNPGLDKKIIMKCAKGRAEIKKMTSKCFKNI
jgi:hypothetical protein